MKLVYKTEERTADEAGVGEDDKNNFFQCGTNNSSLFYVR